MILRDELQMAGFNGFMTRAARLDCDHAGQHFSTASRIRLKRALAGTPTHNLNGTPERQGDAQWK